MGFTTQAYFGGGSAAALAVSDVTLHLATLVREDVILQDVWVRGEISNFTRAASGHLYFSLKDGGACLNCVMWRSSAFMLEFRPETGMEVLAHGQVDVYLPRGQYQLVVDELQPDGAGALQLALEQAKARLLAEGLLDAERKRPLPPFPRRVAVVTSISGAAVRDICVTLRASRPAPDIVLVPTRVQGGEAEESLCAAIELANREADADLIIVGRGGGSMEDLWCFNSERVARAIAGSRVPVISAVGHETDFTLADLAADVRAPTPTAAAELVVDARADLIRRAEAAEAQARGLLLARMENARLRWFGLSRRGPLASPQGIVGNRRQQLDELNARLARARDTVLWRWQHRLALAAGKLDSLSPLATLTRGYATVTRLSDGQPITRTEHIREGQQIRVRLLNGSLVSYVLLVEEEGGTDEPARG